MDCPGEQMQAGAPKVGRASRWLRRTSTGAALALFLASSHAFAGTETARAADDFVEAIGVNVPVGALDVTDLNEIGIRHYRASLQVTPAASINAGYAQYGLRGMFLGSGNQNPTMASEVAAVEAVTPGAVDFFEGPNEVNNTFGSCNCNFKYDGQENGAAAIVYMNDLHTAFQGAPSLADVPILSFTQVYFLPDYVAHLAGLFPFDIENFHPYPAYGPVNYGLYGQTATLDLAGNQYGSLGYNLKACNVEQVGDGGTPKPVIASETGYVQSTYDPVDQGKYVSYMFADYFNGGLKRAYYFTLTHSSDDFGLMDADGNKLPAWNSTHDLIALLAEASWDAGSQTWSSPKFTLDSLDFTLTATGDAGVKDQLDHTVLEKSNGDFVLLLWNEVLAYEVNTKAEITNAALPVTLAVTSPAFTGATVYTRSDTTGSFSSADVSIAGGTMSLLVPDSLMVVVLHRVRPKGDAGLDASSLQEAGILPRGTAA